jgi:hypothetical protein
MIPMVLSMPSTMRRVLSGVLLLGAACTTARSNITTAASPADLPGYPQAYDAVFAAAVDAVALLSWEVRVAERDAGVISAKAPMSFWTWGDKITIRLVRPDSVRGDTLVRVAFTGGRTRGTSGRSSARWTRCSGRGPGRGRGPLGHGTR